MRLMMMLVAACALAGCATDGSAVLVGAQAALMLSAEREPTPGEVRELARSVRVWARSHVAAEQLGEAEMAIDLAIAAWEEIEAAGEGGNGGDWRAVVRALLNVMGGGEETER